MPPPIALTGVLGFVVVGWGRDRLPPGSTGFATGRILLASMPSAPIGARFAHTLPLPVLKRIFAMLVRGGGGKAAMGMTESQMGESRQPILV